MDVRAEAATALAGAATRQPAAAATATEEDMKAVAGAAMAAGRVRATAEVARAAVRQGVGVVLMGQLVECEEGARARAAVAAPAMVEAAASTAAIAVRKAATWVRARGRAPQAGTLAAGRSRVVAPWALGGRVGAAVTVAVAVARLIRP